ncbi:MAG: hypothetical protein ACYDCK_04815 [Thermoplasmatota archaeon]
MPGAMTENATFTPRMAADALADASTFETSLLRRTGGLTWVVWALVSPGIFLSYLVAGLLYGAGGFPWYVGAFLWAPWSFAGAIATVALWRSAALTMRRASKRSPWSYAFVSIALSLVGWAGALLLVPHVNPPTYALLAIGTAWTFVAARNAFDMDPTSRRVAFALGLVTMAAALVLAFTLPAPASQLGLTVASLVGAGVSGGVPLVGGAWLALRG